MRLKRYADAARESLRVAMIAARADLAAMERASDAMERALNDENPGRCGVAQANAPENCDCYGVVKVRWCASCGEIFRRCENHGGLRAATHALNAHQKGCDCE